MRERTQELPHHRARRGATPNSRRNEAESAPTTVNAGNFNWPHAATAQLSSPEEQKWLAGSPKAGTTRNQ